MNGPSSRALEGRSALCTDSIAPGELRPTHVISFRTMCLLYVFENIIDERIGSHDPVGCGGFEPVPLPSPRSLWDYNCSEAWAHRLARFKADGLQERLLTIQDLKHSGSDDAADWEVDGQTVEAMAKWCGGVDEFGALLLMIGLLK